MWLAAGLAVTVQAKEAAATDQASVGASTASATPGLAPTSTDATVASADSPSASGPEAASDAVASDAIYAAYSNESLTALAAQWDTLNVHQRRALLTEVRQRMAQRGAQGAGVIKIRTERRYGRLIRQPDGRVIRIETQVVHVRPATEAEVLASRSAGFGVGFERRTGTQRASGAPAAAGTRSDARAGLPAGRPRIEPASVPMPVPTEGAKPLTAPALQSVP